MTAPATPRSGETGEAPSRPIRRLILVAFAAVLLMAVGVSVALAQDGTLGGKVRAGNDIVIGAGETIDTDLYVFGGQVQVAGTVNGDIVASGGRVIISGPVSGDIVAAGGTIELRGRVDGDVRVAGGSVVVEGDVGEDVLAAGGSVEIAGRVGQDLIVSGGQVTVSGSVAGSATGSAGSYVRTGTITGADDIDVQTSEPPERRAIDLVISALQQILAVVLFGILTIWLAPRVVEASERTIRERPLVALGWGVVALVGFIVLIAVVSVVAILVAVGLGLVGLNLLAGLDVAAAVIVVAALCVAFAAIVAFLVDALVGLALARLIWRRGPPALNDGAERSRLVAMLVVGAAIVVVLTWIPIVGGLIKFIVVLLGLGALVAVAGWPRRPAQARPSDLPT